MASREHERRRHNMRIILAEKNQKERHKKRKNKQSEMYVGANRKEKEYCSGVWGFENRPAPFRG